MYRGDRKIVESVEEVYKGVANTIRELREKLARASAEASRGVEGFKALMGEAKRASERLTNELWEATESVASLAANCSRSGVDERCCSACRELAGSLQRLAVDARPLLDTCYSGDRAERLYGRLQALINEAVGRKDGLDAKLAAVVASTVALELSGDLGEELQWLLQLVLESLGLERRLWSGDLAAVLYAVQAIRGVPGEVRLSRSDAAEILAVLARLGS